MNSAELNKLFIENFPVLQKEYWDEISWQEGDDTGSHIVYGDVLRPHLEERIINNDRQEYQKIFDFLEQLLRLDDKYAEEVVSLSVLESLEYIFKEKSSLIESLGEKCKAVINELLK